MDAYAFLRQDIASGNFSSNMAESILGRKRINWQAVTKMRNRVTITAFAIGSCSLTRKMITVEMASPIVITRTANSKLGSLFGEKWLRGRLNTLLYKQKVHLTVVKYVEKAAV